MLSLLKTVYVSHNLLRQQYLCQYCINTVLSLTLSMLKCKHVYPHGYVTQIKEGLRIEEE